MKTRTKVKTKRKRLIQQLNEVDYHHDWRVGDFVEQMNRPQTQSPVDAVLHDDPTWIESRTLRYSQHVRSETLLALQRKQGSMTKRE